VKGGALRGTSNRREARLAGVIIKSGGRYQPVHAPHDAHSRRRSVWRRGERLR